MILTINQCIEQDRLDLAKSYSEYQSSDIIQKKVIANTIIKKLSSTLVAEEQVLFPFYEEYLVNGELEAKHARKINTDIKIQLLELEKIDTIDSVYDTKLDNIINTIKIHDKNEHDTSKSTFKKIIDPDTMLKLGQKYTQAKRFAPNRPHPDIDNKNIITQQVLHALVSPIDLIKDSGKKFA